MPIDKPKKSTSSIEAPEIKELELPYYEFLQKYGLDLQELIPDLIGKSPKEISDILQNKEKEQKMAELKEQLEEETYQRQVSLRKPIKPPLGTV